MQTTPNNKNEINRRRVKRVNRPPQMKDNLMWIKLNYATTTVCRDSAGIWHRPEYIVYDVMVGVCFANHKTLHI